ncbi:MAG: hypothetical protein ACHQVS_01665 [Candidatus Babeliales bacterium]
MTRIMLVIFSLCIVNGEVVAMHKKTTKSTRSSCCSQRVVKLFSAACIGILCATIGLSAHHDIVEKTKHAAVEKTKVDYQQKINNIIFNYENPCLEVKAKNPAFADYTLTLTPVLCDPNFDTEIVKRVLNRRFGPGTEITTERKPCLSSVVRNGHTQITGISCTHDPEKAAEFSADLFYNRKPKSD